MTDESRTQAIPELLEARARGVVLDPALGAGNFGFDLARQQADIGLLPDTISSDLTAGGRTRVVYSLMECMGRFMAAGYTVEDMVVRATANAAKALNLQDEIGALKRRPRGRHHGARRQQRQVGASSTRSARSSPARRR